jgi:hypothetical protein
MASERVLMVLTSHEDMGVSGNKTEHLCRLHDGVLAAM